MTRYFLLFLLLPSMVLAEDTVTPIPQIDRAWLQFPVVPVVSPPAPPADPEAVPVVRYGEVYAVQADKNFVLRAYPKSLVAVTMTPGPVTVRGIFAGGSGKVETKTLKSPFVAFVDAVEGAVGDVTLVAIPIGLAAEDEITEQLIQIGAGPRPPPPGPTPQPDPIVVPAGFRVMFINESSAPMTREQLNIWNSTKIRDYLTSKCAKSDKGQPEWRFWDKDIKVSPLESKTIIEMWTALKPQLGTLPQVAISVNGKGEVFPMPNTEDEALALLKRFGG